MAALLGLACPSASAANRIIDGLAIVQADGSLRVAGETVYLWGVYLPRLHSSAQIAEVIRAAFGGTLLDRRAAEIDRLRARREVMA